jgi:hypothetical protein
VKAAKRPDFTAVLDDGLTDAYKAAVASALPKGAEATDAFWHDLEVAVDCYISLRSRRPSVRERDRWKRIDRLIDKLAGELREVRKGTPRSHSDAYWPNRALLALVDAKRYAEAGVIGHSMLATASRGRRDRARWYLYHAVLDLWRDHLGQPVRSSKRGGPAIRFVLACVAPLIDEPLSVPTIATIINEHRKGKRRRR